MDTTNTTTTKTSKDPLTLNTKRMPWYANDGGVAFTSVCSFTRSAIAAVKPMRQAMGPESHMRVGTFAVVMFGSRELIAAPIYGDDGLYCDITPESKYWDTRKDDRLRQVATIERALRPTHPHYAAITQAIANERTYFA